MKMSPRIVLVRHGRSGHVHSGWINGAEFLRWREAYEAAGVDSEDVPPLELRELAASSGVVVASVARRAMESAKALAPGRELLSFRSHLSRELVRTGWRGEGRKWHHWSAWSFSRAPHQ